jgi:hypothetical protein
MNESVFFRCCIFRRKWVRIAQKNNCVCQQNQGPSPSSVEIYINWGYNIRLSLICCWIKVFVFVTIDLAARPWHPFSEYFFVWNMHKHNFGYISGAQSVGHVVNGKTFAGQTKTKFSFWEVMYIFDFRLILLKIERSTKIYNIILHVILAYTPTTKQLHRVSILLQLCPHAEQS